MKVHFKFSKLCQVEIGMTRKVKYLLYQAFVEAGLSQEAACKALGYAYRYMPFTWLPKLPPHIRRRWLNGDKSGCRKMSDSELMKVYNSWK